MIKTPKRRHGRPACLFVPNFLKTIHLFSSLIVDSHYTARMCYWASLKEIKCLYIYRLVTLNCYFHSGYQNHQAKCYGRPLRHVPNSSVGKGTLRRQSRRYNGDPH